MNIKFKKVIIDNFFSFDHAELNLEKSGYVLVSGINQNKADMAKSNGSGKSSIWESIIWCLTGDTIRGTKQVVNQSASDGACVKLYFSVDGNEYQVFRYKDTKEYGTNLKFYINGSDKSGKGIRDTEKILNDFLPDLTANLIGSVVILGQGLPQRFTNNTPSGRKEVLETLAKSDFMIEDIKNKLSIRKGILTSNVRTVEDLILSLSSKKQITEERLQKLEKDRESLKVAENLEDEINRYADILNKAKKKEQESLDKKEKIYSRFIKLSDEYESYIAKIDSEYREKCKELDEKAEIDALSKNFYDIKAQIESKKAEIEKLESIKDICPTCGQHIPDVHKVDTKQYKIDLDMLELKLSAVDKSKIEAETYIETEKKKLLENIDINKKVFKDNLNSVKDELDSITKDISDYSLDIRDMTANIDKLEAQKEANNSMLKTLDEDISKALSDISQFEKDILYNNNEKDILEQHLECVNKMTSIAGRDFRGFLLSEVINFIDSRCKDYCKYVFDNENIDFTLDGNNINISYLDKQYENLSGGEKQKIDLIVQFSIRDMLVQFLNFSSNILVLDEIFDNLDEISCQKVLDLISNKINDIESIYIITHHTDISIPYDNQIFIVKDEKGISRIS